MLLARRETESQRRAAQSSAVWISGTAVQGSSSPPWPRRAPWPGRSMDSTCRPLGQTTWANASASSLQPIWPWRNKYPCAAWDPYNTAGTPPMRRCSGCVKIDIQFFRNFFNCLQSGGAYCFSLPLQMQTRSKYAYLSQSLLKGTHEPALQNF